MFDSIMGRLQLDSLEALARRAPPGDFAEIGVFRGGSAWRLYNVALAQGRTLHLFDTFTGTPFYSEGIDSHKRDDEFCVPDGDIERMREFMPLARFYPGVYPRTHPKGLSNIAFVHVDCDQYDSYRGVIDVMWPKVVPEGMMLFDDYPYLEGAKAAVEETFSPKTLRQSSARYYVIKGG